MQEEKSVMSIVKELLKDALGSKKVMAVITGVVVNIAVLAAAKFGISEEVASAVATKCTVIIFGYVAGQSVADAGKSAKKIEVESKLKEQPKENVSDSSE